jgi:hypothetical protein
VGICGAEDYALALTLSRRPARSQMTFARPKVEFLSANKMGSPGVCRATLMLPSHVCGIGSRLNINLSHEAPYLESIAYQTADQDLQATLRNS